jgi:zinc protease
MSLQAPPAVSLAKGWRFPGHVEHRLENGLRVLVYQCPGQYVASASVVVDLPLTVEPPDLEGVAELTARCLSRGTSDLTAEQFADALAATGADLQAGASLDALTARVNVPVTRLEDGLRLLVAALADATFPAAEVSHERGLRLQEIEQAHAHPSQVANEQLNAALFGSARAARPVGGSATTVAGVDREHVATFAERWLTPDLSTLVLVGDFTGINVEHVVSRCLADWSGSQQPPSATEKPPIADAASLLFIEWPDAPQSTLRVAGPGVTRADPLWPALFVANHAVGGSFSSRINTVLREEKGYTYGATSSLDSSRSAGLFTVSTAVTTGATAAAVSDILAIVAGARGTLTDEEVGTAVRAVTASAPLGYERAEAIASRVELLLSQDLPLSHVDANLDRIAEVTTETANAAYASVVRPSALTVLVVGSPEILPELTAVGSTPLQQVALPWRT